MPQVGGQATAVMELTQFDAAKNQYLQRETQKMDGRLDQISEDWKNAAELLTEARADQLIAHCPDAGGSSASLTVPAGSLDTCELPVKTRMTPRAFAAK